MNLRSDAGSDIGGLTEKELNLALSMGIPMPMGGAARNYVKALFSRMPDIDYSSARPGGIRSSRGWDDPVGMRAYDKKEIEMMRLAGEDLKQATRRYQQELNTIGLQKSADAINNPANYKPWYGGPGYSIPELAQNPQNVLLRIETPQGMQYWPGMNEGSAYYNYLRRAGDTSAGVPRGVINVTDGMEEALQRSRMTGNMRVPMAWLGTEPATNTYHDIINFLKPGLRRIPIDSFSNSLPRPEPRPAPTPTPIPPAKMFGEQMRSPFPPFFGMFRPDLTGESP